MTEAFKSHADGTDATPAHAGDPIVPLPEVNNRRAARWTLGLAAICVTLGNLLAALLLMAHVTVDKLVSASLEHLRVWSLMSDKLPHLAKPVDEQNFAQFLRVYKREYSELVDIEQVKRREVDRLLGILKSPLITAFAFLEASDINYFERLDVSSRNRAMVLELASAPDLNGGWGEFHQKYQALIAAKSNGELLYPLGRRAFFASEMVTRGVKPMLVVLFLIAVSVLIGIRLAWRLALEPALKSVEDNAVAIRRQNVLLREAEAQIVSAQRTARLAYWIKNIDDESLSGGNMAEVLGCSHDTLPTTLEALAGLSPPEDRAKALQAYRSLQVEDGTVELSRTILAADGRRITIRERVECRTDGGARLLMGTMLDISELTQANEELARLAQVQLIEVLISRISHDFNNILSVIQGGRRTRPYSSGGQYAIS